MSHPAPAAGSDARAGRPALVAVVAATLLVMLPTLRPGFLLTYDMVFVPHLPFTADLVGLGTRLPRAVPSDFLVAVASRVVPGDVVQKLILVAVLVGAGIGAARLAPTGSVGKAAAGVAYLWNPYVYERLVIGHWTLLVGYAALPWVVAAGASVRRGDRGGWPRLLVTLGAGACGGASAWLLTALVAPIVVGWPGARPPDNWRRTLARTGGVAGALLVLALPWAVPGALRPKGIALDPEGNLIFAARADTSLGTLGSLLTGGGIWNAEVAPPGRMSLFYAAAALALLAASMAGLRLLRRSWPILLPLIAAAGIGLVLAAASTAPVLREMAHAIPGGGLLRDAQKFAAVWVLLTSVGFGAFADALSRTSVGRTARVLAALLVLTPAALLPALGWGASGRLHPVQYPKDWSHAVAVVGQDNSPGAVLVLPWQPYRRYAWNGNRVLLDPSPRWFNREVIASAELPVRTGDTVQTVGSEDPLAARFDTAMRNPDTLLAELRRTGVAYVVVDGLIDDPRLRSVLSKLRRLTSDPTAGSAEVTVYAVDTPLFTGKDATRGLTPPRAPIIAADIAWITFLGVSMCAMVYRRPRRLIA